VTGVIGMAGGEPRPLGDADGASRRRGSRWVPGDSITWGSSEAAASVV